MSRARLIRLPQNGVDIYGTHNLTQAHMNSINQRGVVCMAKNNLLDVINRGHVPFEYSSLEFTKLHCARHIFTRQCSSEILSHDNTLQCTDFWAIYGNKISHTARHSKHEFCIVSCRMGHVGMLLKWQFCHTKSVFRGFTCIYVHRAC